MILSQEQSKIIEHEKGPLLIVAGAGTGKTTAITQKIASLIIDKKTSPNSILATTFTQKSAKDLIARLDTILPLGYEEPWMGTFHGICDRILRQEGLEIGLDSDFKVATAVEQWLLIYKNIYRLNLQYYRPLSNPAKFINSLIKFFSRIQDENLKAQEGLIYARNLQKNATSAEEREVAEKYVELFEAFSTYTQIKQDESILDFGDLIQKTINLFVSRPSILKKYQQQFSWILVDEFQDTNTAQYELIKILAPAQASPNLLVVGDDDQSIYRFRGASVSNILNFKSDYPNTKEVVMTQNYRSNQSILDASYRLITNNNPDRLESMLGVDKKLKSQVGIKDNKNCVKIIQTKTSNDEVEFVIRNIIDQVSKEGITYKDIAILSRANDHLQSFAYALKRAGIPYQLVSNKGLFDQPEIKYLTNFLTVITNPLDDLALFEFLHFPTFNTNQSQNLKMIQTAKHKTTPLWEIIQAEGEYEEIKNAVEIFQQKSKDSQVSRLLYEFIIEHKYIQSLVKEESVESSLRIKNINLFFDKIKEFENKQSRPNLIEFMATFALWQLAGENPGQATIEDIDTVNLMTVHASKGLEFSVVYIVNCVQGRFPAVGRRDAIELPQELAKEIITKENEGQSEERRLMYVALTRAKKEVILTFAENYGGLRDKKPSGFLEEIGIEKQIIQSNREDDYSVMQDISPLVTHLNQAGEVEIKSLSYTQIDTFKGCPLKYKYRYILKIPTLPYHTLTFGRSIHETLYEFHRQAQLGNNMSLEELLALFEKNFDQTGYDTPEHRHERFKQAQKDLTDYYHHHAKLFGKPAHLERAFKLKIGEVVINGKIDRIDEDSEGEFEIIDYKTGKTKSDKEVKKDDQLSLYALASSEVFGIMPKKMSLYFMESGKKIETQRNTEDLMKIKKKLEKDISALKNSTFPAKPDKVRCGFCEYNKICPFRAKP